MWNSLVSFIISKVKPFTFYFSTFVFLACNAFAGLEIKPLERPEYHFPQLAGILAKLNEKAPHLIEANLDLDEAIANESIAASESGFKLGISLSGQSVYEDRPNENYHQRYRALGSVHLRKPVYHWGALRAKRDISSIDRSNTHKNFIALKRSLTGEVRSSFLDLVVLGFRARLAEEGLNLAVQNLNDVKQQLELGRKSSIDVDEVEIYRLNREIEWSELKVLVSKNEARFRALSGYGEILNFDPSGEFLSFCMDHSFSLDLPILVGAASSAETDRISSMIEKENHRIIIAESELLPKLNFSSAFYQDQVAAFSNKQNLDRNNIVVGLEANWAWWDSGKSKAEKSAALARKRKYESSLSRSNRDLRMALDSMRSELSSLIDRVSLSRKLSITAERRLRKCKLEVSQNRMSSADLHAAQLAFDESRLSNVESVCRYLLALDLYEQQVSYDSIVLD